MNANQSIHLISRWYLKEGMLEEAIPVFEKLALDVLSSEPDTLTYLVHYPVIENKKLTSLPLTSEREVTFFEIYKNEVAFETHVKGPIFTDFVNQYGYLFEQSEENTKDKPFHTVSFLSYQAGFSRPNSLIDIPPLKKY